MVLKKSCDKSATSLRASGKRGSRRRRGQISGDVTGLSRTCRGRHREVGIMEFGLNQAREHAYPTDTQTAKPAEFCHVAAVAYSSRKVRLKVQHLGNDGPYISRQSNVSPGN